MEQREADRRVAAGDLRRSAEGNRVAGDIDGRRQIGMFQQEPGDRSGRVLLSERKKLSVDVQAILDSQTEIWGIKVSNVEIRTVELTENMVRAIAKQGSVEDTCKMSSRRGGERDGLWI
jgi:hypothetical protein